MSAGPTTLRQILRRETVGAHGRLHEHSGLAAATRGDIGLGDYKLLLLRLYGFHKPFEDLAAFAGAQNGFTLNGRSRSALLLEDLKALGQAPAATEAAPCCGFLRWPSSPAEFLGALYVVEGSTLGGAKIGRALAPRFGGASRFFFGHDQDLWRKVLDGLETLAGDAACKAAAVSGALATFADFEVWMRDWAAGGADHQGDATSAPPTEGRVG